MKRLPIVLLLCISISISAQTNFVRGYIVKVSGDTIRGYLQEEFRKEIVSSIQFKSDNTSQVQTFVPSAVNTFCYSAGNLYKTISFKNTLNDPATDETYFVLQLVTGAYHLYSFIQNEQTYFIVVGNNTSYLLYNTVSNSNGETKVEGNYNSRLQLLATSCTLRNIHSDDITYSEKDIANFVNNLNKCVAPTTASTNYYQSAKTITKVSIFAGGLVLGKNKSQFTADVAFRIIYPQLSKNIFLNIGAHYSHTSKDQTEKAFGSTALLSITKDDIISVPLTLQYNILTGIVQPFVYGGFAGAYLKEKSVYTVYTNAPSGKPDKFGLSAIGAIGIEVYFNKNFYAKAEWRYELLVQNPAVGLAYNF